MIEDDPAEDGMEFGPEERVALELLGLPAEREDDEQNVAPANNDQDMNDLPPLNPGMPRIVATFSLAPYNRVFRKQYDRNLRRYTDVEIDDLEAEDEDRHNWSDNTETPMTHFIGKRNFHTTLAMVKDKSFNFFNRPAIMFVHHQDGVLTNRENDETKGHQVELHFASGGYINGFTVKRPNNYHLYADMG